MTNNLSSRIILLIIIAFFTNCNHQNSFHKETEFDFSSLSGPYLGQKPPGILSEIFAPGIISTGYSERIAAFTHDGKELYYVMTGAPHSVILNTKEVNGKWIKPEVVSFSGKRSTEFNISPDGNKIVYIHKPHKPNDPVWMVERNGGTWGEPYTLPPFINGYPTISKNDNLYFNSLNENNGSWDLFLSKFENGKYSKPMNLGNIINNEFHEADPFIASDESYLIFSRKGLNGFGGADLLISFHKKDGNWSKPVNMGENINSDADEYCPTVSPDGKYFFFLSFRKTHKNYSEIPITLDKKIEILNSPGNGNGDIYWIDARIINNLKPKDLK